MTCYQTAHNKIVLLTQQGGCGAHFIISLASFYFNSCNNQLGWHDSLIDKFNGYIGIHTPFIDTTESNANLTQIIRDNVNENDYIFKGCVYQEWLDLSLYAIQQCHVHIDKLNQHYNHKVIRVFTEDKETMLYCLKLDSIKNKQPYKHLITLEQSWKNFIGINTQPSNNLDLFDFNYNEIILKSNYKEFANFANWLEAKPPPEHIFKYRIKHYNQNNEKTLDLHE